MLAVAKVHHTNITIDGAEANAIIKILQREINNLQILGMIDYSADNEEYVNVCETDFWKNNTTGDLLAGTRLKHQLTQEQLAEKTGIPQNVISAYETGKRKLTQKAAMKIGEALNENYKKFFHKV